MVKRLSWFGRLLRVGGVLLLVSGAVVDGQDGAGRPAGEKTASKTTVGLINAKQFRGLLARQRGTVTVINLWATWCIPCIQEFPDLAKLQAQYQERGLKVIAISFDDPEDLETKVKRFVEQRSVNFATYVQTESDPERFVGVLDPTWSGVVPTTFVLDRAGKLKATMVGRRSLEQFEAAVAPLLKTP
jgi:thiol-disulfide isomerase/thioredoxin